SIATDEAEAATERRTNRRLRRLLVGTSLTLVLALIAGALAVVQRNRAGTERDRARAVARTASLRALVDTSATQQSTKRDLAALLAVAAYRLDPSAASEGALLRTFIASPGFQRSIPLPGGKSALDA